MNIIGITGPTGAGKTTALLVLQSLGAAVIDADAVYHALLSESGELRAALSRAFGAEILNEAGEVDRRRLSRLVYPDRLDELNRITHPVILAAIEQRLSQARREGRSAAALDAIALIEGGLGERCDAIVAVLAPLETRVRRIMDRDNIDEAYARRRALAQKPDEFFRRNSNFILENAPDDTPERFRARAESLFREILENLKER